MRETDKGADFVPVLTDEDAMRAQFYRLLAGLLSRAPDRGMLDRLGRIQGGSGDLGTALGTLGQVARAADAAAVDDEYHALFIGVGRGELMPYGSYYMTGFVYDRPLARLRDDMARLGIARAEDVTEPEDHIASICDMMAGLIEGAFGVPVDLAEQRKFFDMHLAPWAGQFFADLEGAKSASFYMPVGRVGRAFVEVESTAFAMAA